MSKKNKIDKKWLKEENTKSRRLARENLSSIDRPRKPIPKSFIAKYDGGECPMCFEKILEGQVVRFNADDEIVHARHKKVEEDYEICPSCFLTIPCMCDE